MIVYKETKKGFMDDVLSGDIADIVQANLHEKLHLNVSPSEVTAFQNSLTFMSLALQNSELNNETSVSIEYRIPNTSKRIDFIISGLNHERKPSAIIIELKQWQAAEEVPNSDGLVRTVVGGGKRVTTHPSYQAWSYESMLTEFNENVYRIPIELKSCVFMHNYTKVENKGVYAPQYKEYTSRAPIFSKKDIRNLANYIEKTVAFPHGHKTIESLESGKIKPSKSLQDALNGMVDGNQEFILIDEQKVIYEQIIALAKKSNSDNKKRVMIVEGGPGTGKSVVAVNLLVKLTSNDFHCRYVTKNSAPRQVYQYYLKKNGKKKKQIDYLFTGSGSFVDAPTNFYNALIVDEAHRLNEKSGLFANMGENQIKEIINASKFSVFFIDSHQKIHINDIGTIGEIEKWANYLNAETYHGVLESQFRCNGSDGYIAWLENVLQMNETANTEFDFDYDFKVFDDINELRNAIFEKNRERNKSRLLAGYCWEWKSKQNPELYDIEFPEYDFKMRWNFSNEIFAISDSSVNEIGCIHTSQGLEFDYVGVIIGADLIYEDGKVKTDYKKRANSDASVKGIKGMIARDPENGLKLADEIIRNTYRTLMTRGMKGCYVYCMNNSIRDYLISTFIPLQNRISIRKI